MSDCWHSENLCAQKAGEGLWAAATHYERWAKACGNADAEQSLRTGRDYELDNAAVLERLFPGVDEQQQTLLERFPELPQTFELAFAGLSLAEQLRAQAAAEAVGAELYRGFAGDYPDPAGQAELMHCAELEQANADLLLDAAAHL